MNFAQEVNVRVGIQNEICIFELNIKNPVLFCRYSSLLYLICESNKGVAKRGGIGLAMAIWLLRVQSYQLIMHSGQFSWA